MKLSMSKILSEMLCFSDTYLSEGAFLYYGRDPLANKFSEITFSL